MCKFSEWLIHITWDALCMWVCVYVADFVDADNFVAVFIVKMVQLSSTLCVIELVSSSFCVAWKQDVLEARELPQFGNIWRTNLNNLAEYIAQTVSYQL